MRSYMAVVVAVVMGFDRNGGRGPGGRRRGGLRNGEGAATEWIHNSNSSKPEQAMDAAVHGSRSACPVETGVLPGRSVKSGNGRWLNMDLAEQNMSPELRGHSNIQAGP